MERRRFSIEDNGVLTEDSRCRLSDGRRWRCPMPALPNISFCRHHRDLSKKSISNSELQEPDLILDSAPVTDSDPEKLNRTFDPLPMRKKKRRKKEIGAVRSSSAPTIVALQAKAGSDSEIVYRASDPQKKKRRRRQKGADSDPIAEDLIRMAVKRQMKRKEEREEKKRSEKQEDVMRRELPNGVMAISPSPLKSSSNGDGIVDRKLGLGFSGDELLKRRIRSKNVEPEPVGLVKRFPRVLGKCRNMCNGRGGKKTAGCKTKSGNTRVRVGVEENGFEESPNFQKQFSRIRYAYCSLSQLLPLLEPSWKQIFELEIEANSQGKRLAGVQLQVVDCSHDVQSKCNFCRISIVSMYRSCSNCYYKLCLSCCQEIRGESLAKGQTCQDRKEQKTCNHDGHMLSEIMMQIPSKLQSPVVEQPTKNKDESTPCLPSKLGGWGDCEMSNEIRMQQTSKSHSLIDELADKNRDDSMPCPPSELGGCGDGVLNINFIMPFGWKQKLDSIEQFAFSWDPEGCLNGV